MRYKTTIGEWVNIRVNQTLRIYSNEDLTGLSARQLADKLDRSRSDPDYTSLVFDIEDTTFDCHTMESLGWDEDQQIKIERVDNKENSVNELLREITGICIMALNNENTDTCSELKKCKLDLKAISEIVKKIKELTNMDKK